MPGSNEKDLEYLIDKRGDNEDIELGNSHVHRNLQQVPILLSIHFRHILIVTVSLPLLSFIFNIFYVCWVDFELATNTICSSTDHRIVPNVLPSFSAVIGLFEFPKCLWSICIAFHATPRILFLVMMTNYLDTMHLPIKYKSWIRSVSILGSIEIGGLIILTTVSSKTNFPIHMWSFISFVIGSELYMLIVCSLLKIRHSLGGTNSNESKSLRLKWKLAIMNIVCAIASAFIYHRHVTYCEPGVYSFFALAEYIVVLTNIGFHATMYWDFYHRKISI